MSPEWTPSQLGQVGKWFSGGTPRLETREYWGGSIPWVSPKDMKRFELSDTEDHITEKGLEKGSRAVESGNVLIVVRGMILAHTFPVALVMKRMAFNQDIKAIRCHPHVDPRFLAHWLVGESAKILTKVTDTSHGTKRFDVRQLQRHALLLPPRGEQRVIAAILDAVDVSIEHTQKAINIAQLLKQGLLENLLRSGLGKSGSKPSLIGHIPADWDCPQLGNHILDGPTNGMYRPESDYGPAGTPIIRIDSFDDGVIHSQHQLRRVRRLSDVDIARYGIAEGDVVINRVNSLSHIGKAALVTRVDEPTVFESNMMRLRLKANLLPRYLIGVLCSSIARRHWLVRAKPAVNQASVNQRDVRALRIPMPPLQEQDKIATLFEAATANVLRLNASLHRYLILKRGLMQDLLTGRVRVKPPAASGNGIVRSRP